MPSENAEQPVRPDAGGTTTTPGGSRETDTDITERNTGEELYGRRLRQNQRLESIGTLAGGIAHDINNALTPALLSVNLLRSAISNKGQIALLDNIETSIERCARMVEQVVLFARGVEGERDVLDPRSLVRDVEEFVQDTFPKNILLRVRAPDNAWPVTGDPAQLHQLLLNLCLNASDAMPSGGRLSITLDNVHISPLREPDPERQGYYVKISVADTGRGISSENLERIFDPFFTTKDVGSGSGMGLSITHSIAKSHGGFVHVESSPGQGAKFEVYLPAEREVAGVAPTDGEQFGLAPCRGATILVVDDEELLLGTLCTLLETFGYKVMRSRNGMEALRIFSRYSNDIDLVLIDLLMPEMDGVNAIKKMHEIDPSVRAVVATGQPFSGKPHKAIRHCITKPYSQCDVLMAIREVLEEES